MEEIVITGARTPGKLQRIIISASDLGQAVIKENREMRHLSGNEVSEVILAGPHCGSWTKSARQAAINAGLPVEVSAWGPNPRALLRSMPLAPKPSNGDSQIVIAGGQESMSQSSLRAAEGGVKMGNSDSLIR